MNALKSDALPMLAVRCVSRGRMHRGGVHSYERSNGCTCGRVPIRPQSSVFGSFCSSINGVERVQGHSGFSNSERSLRDTEASDLLLYVSVDKKSANSALWTNIWLSDSTTAANPVVVAEAAFTAGASSLELCAVVCGVRSPILSCFGSLCAGHKNKPISCS